MLTRRVSTMKRRTESPLDGILTPDRRYLVVRGRLWRASNPALPPEDRIRWTKALMSARRAVGQAGRTGDPPALHRARGRVDRAKRALGERGPVWWTDGAPDYNRRLVRNTPYSVWYEDASRFAGTIQNLLRLRRENASICPSDVARAERPVNWRTHMETVRWVGAHLARRGLLTITQRGDRLNPDEPIKGPVRFSLPDRESAGAIVTRTTM